MRSFAGMAVGIAIFSHALWAQPSPATSGNVGISRVTSGQPAGGNYLTGNVMLDDGGPPPDPVTIERVCGGKPRAQAYTDRKGRFTFQIGQTSGVAQDASDAGPGLQSRLAVGAAGGVGLPSQVMLSSAPDLQLANCELRAVLSGFRSDTVSLVGRRLEDDPNVGTIVLHRMANVEGSAVSKTSLQAPKEARQAYDKALQYSRKSKLPEAAKQLHAALDIYPNYAAAWYELGRIQEQTREIEQARQSFARSLAADAKFLNPYLGLAELEASAGNWAALAEITSRLLKLDAVDYPMAYLYNATANLELRRIEAAETSARDGEKLDTAHRFPKLEQVLATILAQKKDYAGAAAHLRAYLALAPDAEDTARIKKELADLERLSGEHAQAKAEAAQP
ncbi:MAG: tetratricopeptide repeat protein [Bryobacteraceae bacterium]